MKKLLVPAFAPLLCLVILGCGPKQAEETVFNVALNEDIAAVDPAFTYDFTTNQVVNQITEGLVTFDTETLEVIPHLAKSWAMTDDLTYVYQVRDDVKFSDGSAMTMEDVIFSFERIRDPDTGSYLEWMLGGVESITQTGDWELTITLAEPSQTFKFVPATAAGRVISKKYFLEHEENFGTAEGGILATGPFVFESWTSGQEVIIKRNANYWNPAVTPEVDAIVYRIIPEDTTRVIALRNGESDFTVNPPLDMIDVLSSDPSLSLSSIDSFSVSFLAFNTQRAPFNEPNVRKAIYHALDLPALRENIIKTAGAPGTILPFGTAMYGEKPEEWRDYLNRTVKYPYDLAKAQEYLAQTSVAGGFSCDVLINEGSLSQAKGLFVQDALAKLNIAVNIVKLSGDEHTNYQFGGAMDSEGKRDYDMIIADWEADYPDVSGNVEPFYLSDGAGEGGANAAAYMNPQVDAHLASQGKIMDTSARNQVFFQAFDIINNEVPYIFFEYPAKQSVLSKKYTGAAINSAWLWVLPLQNVKAAAN